MEKETVLWPTRTLGLLLQKQTSTKGKTYLQFQWPSSHSPVLSSDHHHHQLLSIKNGVRTILEDNKQRKELLIRRSDHMGLRVSPMSLKSDINQLLSTKCED